MQVNLDETVKTLTFNQTVVGSIPTAPSNFFKGLSETACPVIGRVSRCVPQSGGAVASAARRLRGSSEGARARPARSLLIVGQGKPRRVAAAAPG